MIAINNREVSVWIITGFALLFAAGVGRMLVRRRLRRSGFLVSRLGTIKSDGSMYLTQGAVYD